MKPTMSMCANSKDCEAKRRAYEFGERAFEQGIDINEVPGHTENIEDWKQGWMDAYAESK